MNDKKKLIRQKLIETREHCKFKEAWIPEGWACVEIEEFSADLARALDNAERKQEMIDELKK